ncbi:MAG TPA: TerB family tellurite resistance protein [Gammaproteobacteria bacterium]|nr:TerB family tellurite resistance protein [Gammaproteobacteria bacterium]
MLQHLREFFTEHAGRDSQVDLDERLRVACAALMVEMERADARTDAAEQHTVARLLAEHFSLTEEQTARLLEFADERADDATSLYEFTSLIHAHFSIEEKRELLAMLWRTAYADGRLNKYEEALVRKVAELLYIPHQDFIAIKLRVQGETS